MCSKLLSAYARGAQVCHNVTNYGTRRRRRAATCNDEGLQRWDERYERREILASAFGQDSPAHARDWSTTSALVLGYALRSSSDETRASKRHCSGENEDGTTI